MQHIDEQYILDNFESALEHGCIKAYYQPVIRTLTEQICSVEALARWADPVAGLLSPYLFISVLEKNKLIHKLDLMMLKNICHTYNEMREKGLPLHPFSINLSRLDFDEMDMPTVISDILKMYNVPSNAIHIEITESVMLDNTTYFRKIFDCLHDAGFSIFMDDFGSGYSSLNVLKDYSFDVLKIDMRFLSDIGARSKKILSSVVNMAKAIGMHTLAEGVENETQRSFLRNIGCEMLQGYYYSKPMSSEEYIEYLSSCDITVEGQQESDYWEQVGRINFLSPDPLNEFVSDEDNDDDDITMLRESSATLALAEISESGVKFRYASKTFIKELKKIGYNGIRDLEEAIENVPESSYREILDQVRASLKTGELIKRDYFYNNLYFSYSSKCIAKTENKYMLAVSMHSFSPTHSADRAELFDKYSRVLIDTYDHITVVDHNTNSIVTRLYSKIGFNNDYLTLPLDKAKLYFAEKEIPPSERERFLRFIDPDNIEATILKTDNLILQQPFHIKNPNGDYVIKDIRIFKTTVDGSEKILFIIQSMSASAEAKALEVMNEACDKN